jgi:hypothetical protein
MRRLAPRGVQRGQAIARPDDPMTLARKQLLERAQLGFALERNQDHAHASHLPPRSRPSDGEFLGAVYACFRNGSEPAKEYDDEGVISHA